MSSDVFAPTAKYEYLPAVVANYQVVAKALAQPDNVAGLRQANDLLKRVNAEAGTASIFVMDGNGYVIASSNSTEPDSFVGKNFGYRPYYLEAWRKGNGAFYGVGAVTSVPGYFMARRVTANSKALGVVVVKADISGLRSKWRNFGSEMMMEDENGIVFLSSRDEWMFRTMTALDAATVARLKTTRQYSNVLSGQLQIARLQNLKPDERIIKIRQMQKNGEGTEYVSYFVKTVDLPDSPWKIHLLISTEGVWTDSAKISVIAVGSVLVLVLLAMYLRQLYARRRERKEAWLAMEASHDALEQKNRELLSVSEELRIQSITDSLTGSYNRRFFMESTAKMISAAQRHHHALAVVMIDVDHFKQINDVYGHPAGDQVLRTLAGIYREALREDDIFARFGGEEFIMALAYTDEREAEIVAERLREKIMEQSFNFDGEVVQITISTGITQLRPNDKNMASVIKRADEALYQAKESGRNRVVVSGDSQAGKIG